jgi:hypothetical protein
LNLAAAEPAAVAQQLARLSLGHDMERVLAGSPARVSGAGPSHSCVSCGRVSGCTVMPTWRLPHRLQRKRRSNCRTVASGPMMRSAARMLIGAEWPQPAKP